MAQRLGTAAPLIRGLWWILGNQTGGTSSVGHDLGLLICQRQPELCMLPLDGIVRGEPGFQFGPKFFIHCEKLVVPPTGSERSNGPFGVRVPDHEIEPQVTPIEACAIFRAMPAPNMTAPGVTVHGMY